jgi:glutaredoxin
VKYDEFKLDIDFTRENLLEMYSEARSFPVVVVDGFHIGGYEQLKTILTEETKNTSKLLNEGV